MSFKFTVNPNFLRFVYTADAKQDRVRLAKLFECAVFRRASVPVIAPRGHWCYENEDGTHRLISNVNGMLCIQRRTFEGKYVCVAKVPPTDRNEKVRFWTMTGV
jgi:hypothetical protein